MKTALVLCVSAVLCWIVLIVINPSNIELVLAAAAVVLTIAFLCFLAISISQCVNKSISPYRVFAVVDGLIGLCDFIYAIYDIKTGTGDFGGLIGVLLLIFVLPIIAALLLVDFLVWRARRPGKSNK